jgi:hypothetical protein
MGSKRLFVGAVVVVVVVGVATFACGGILGVNEDDPPADTTTNDAGPNATGSTEGGGGTPDSSADGAPLVGCTECFVFILSTPVRPAGPGFQSALDADQKCDDVGKREDAGALRGKHFTAWVSDPTSAASSRLSPLATTFRRLDGNTIAASVAQFVAGPHRESISIDENGVVLSDAAVWTGTLEDGGISPDTCGSWRVGTAVGTAGFASEIDRRWTNQATRDCITPYRLYCIER